VTAPTDHLAAARAALADATATGPRAAHAFHVARAQVHATLALAEETRTANLIRALDYNIGHLNSDERRAEITKRLWPTYLAVDEHLKAHPPKPPVDEGAVVAMTALLWGEPISRNANELARRLVFLGIRPPVVTKP